MIINYFAVAVAALVAMIVKTVWYSPMMFGAYWMRLRGHGADAIKHMNVPAAGMLIELVCALITAYVLAIFVTVFGAHTLYSTLLLGVIIWVGFYLTPLLGEVAWEGKPFGLAMLSAGWRLINLVLMTAIIGLWQ